MYNHFIAFEEIIQYKYIYIDEIYDDMIVNNNFFYLIEDDESKKIKRECN
jgi:hypothetical protein